MKQLLAFDYQGVFHTPDGAYQQELFDFVSTRPADTIIAIVSNLPRTSLLRELTTQHVSLEHIQVYGYEDMESKAAAIKELQKLWKPKTTIFVTDTVRDIQDVRQTNATILASTWGYDSRDHLQAAAPHAMLGSAKKLIDYLSAIL